MKQPIVINGGSYSYSADLKKDPLHWRSSDGADLNLKYFSDIFQYLSDYIVEDILLSAVNDEVSHYIKSGEAPSQEEHEFGNIRESIREALSPFDNKAWDKVGLRKDWWRASFGGGLIYFTASSNSHAYSKASKWGKKVGLGNPDTIKRAERPHALEQRGAFKHDEELDIYVEQ